MANTRIKDLSTTATDYAVDDYVVLDGATNGTRKILATDMSSEVSTTVRNALYTLLSKAAYTETGLDDELAIVQSWAADVTAISLDQSTLTISGIGTAQLTATTVPAGAAVTWTSSDTSIATVDSTGLVTSVANGSATITASAGDKSATCAVTVSGIVALVSISAVYTQGGTVYNTDTLDSLKTDLVVTATYDDSTTATIASSDYTLSGTLTVGTSTITVTYGGMTDTFTVTVTQSVTALYDWDFTTSMTDSVNGIVAATNATQDSSGITFDGTNQYLVLIPGSTMSMVGKAVEIDIGSMSVQQTGTHARVFSITTNSSYNTSNNSDTFLRRQNSGWYIYNGSWSSDSISISDYPPSYFSGKTLRIEYDASGYPSIYADGTLIHTYGSNACTRTGYLVLGGSSSDYLYHLAPTITGVRIYSL